MKTYLVLCLALLTGSCNDGSGGTPQTPSRSQPLVQAAMVFALMDVGDPKATLDDFAGRAIVDGLALRTAWKTLEPQAGNYDWAALDTAFDVVRAHGKRLTLHVGASALGIPNWLAGLGVVTYTYNSPQGVAVTEPLPWDATFLSRYGQFLTALSAHIQARGDTDLLYAISNGVPVAEMSLFGCRDGNLSGDVPLPYSRENYLEAWKTTTTAHAAAFAEPALFISAPVGMICFPDNGAAFYTDVMDHALTLNAKTTVFAADLNALGSARLAQVSASLRTRAAIAFQTIWSSTDDTQKRMQGTLMEAICEGIGSGARYFEIYKADIASSDAAIQAAIQRVRTGQSC